MVEGWTLARIFSVKAPVPGPYSTIQLVFSKSIAFIIAVAKYLLLGRTAPTLLGFLIYSNKNILLPLSFFLIVQENF